MGRGNKPYESNIVNKQRTIYSRTSFGGGTGGGISQNTSKDDCLFSFKLKINISTDIIYQINDPVALVLGTVDQIDIFIKGIKTISYNGSFKRKLLKCIENNYVYTGKIESIENKGKNQEIIILINGHGV